MTTPKELRGERLKAHAKMRDEVRNAVKEEMLREGIGRKEISEALMGVIHEKVEGTDMQKLIRQALREELDRIVGGSYVQKLVEKMLKDEAGKLAADFIERSVLVTTTDKEHW